MKNSSLFKKVILGVNILMIAAIFVLNYFYQKNGFDFTLKCVCSGGFALLGIINLLYAIFAQTGNLPFQGLMALGLVLAMAGDVAIGYDFIIGAAVFALGHICFVIAYCFEKKPHLRDLLFSGILFGAGGAFLLFSPLLSFDVPVYKIVCLVYALIISTMLGKALSNCITLKSPSSCLIALASALFFFSDLMLVFDWFIGLWDWTDNACMGSYYPALCFLALSMLLKSGEKENLHK